MIEARPATARDAISRLLLRAQAISARITGTGTLRRTGLNGRFLPDLGRCDRVIKSPFNGHTERAHDAHTG